MLRDCVDVRLIWKILFSNFLSSSPATFADGCDLVFTVNGLILLIRSWARSLVKVGDFGTAGIIIISTHLPMFG